MRSLLGHLHGLSRRAENSRRLVGSLYMSIVSYHIFHQLMDQHVKEPEGASPENALPEDDWKGRGASQPFWKQMPLECANNVI